MSERPFPKAGAAPITWVNWSTFRAPDAGETGIVLALKGNKSYTLRFFGNPMRIFRYYSGGRSAITIDPSTSPIALRHHGIRPHLRYVTLVLDRRNHSIVRMVELPETLFKQIAELCGRRGVNPGCESAPDLIIHVIGEGIFTRYDVDCGSVINHLSENEKKAINTAFTSGYRIEAVYGTTSDILAALGMSK